MGGLGSGNRYRFDKKTTAEECQAVDIRYLHRNGLLSPGRGFSLSWSRAGGRETGSIIRAVVYRDRVVLSYRHRGGLGGEWEEVEEPVFLEWTPCNFGGERPWFVCPGVACGRRVAVLYGPGKYFLCRHCYDLPRFWRDPLSTLANAQREDGDVVRMDLGTRRFYLLSRPDHVKWVLRENAKNYLKGYDKVKVLLGNGLVMNEGASWLQQRRLIQPAFHQSRLEKFTVIMVEETQKVLERWEALASEGGTLDVAEEMKLLAQRIIVRTMFGAEVGAEDKKIARAFDTALLGIDVRSLMPRWFGRLPIPFNKRFQRALATLDEEVYRIIRQRRRGEHGKGDDLLAMLMETRDEETGESMSDRQLRDEVMTIYLAGHETTANALSWVWYLLSKNPEAARKVGEEVSCVLGGRSPSFEDLPRLVYTRMVIDETLRLYPPVWIVSRKALEDDEIGRYHVPAGSRLMLSPYVTHRRAELWENPERFDPERFASGSSSGGQRYAYYPFGGGPRQCIGNNFALMQATLVVSTVSQRYRLALVPGQEVRAQPKATLKPLPGVWMTLHAASSALPRA